MTKRTLYIFGLITLLVFPIPTFAWLYFFEGIVPLEILNFDSFQLLPIIYGLALGIGYAFLASLVMSAKVFDKLPVRIEVIIRNMKLTILDCIFISICAGVGEELLFRSGVQFYLHPVITSVLFVAIHGYLNPWNWRMSLYGFTVLPLIIIISYGFVHYGLWFAASAHFAYDFILFASISRSKRFENTIH